MKLKIRLNRALLSIKSSLNFLAAKEKKESVACFKLCLSKKGSYLTP